MDSLIRWAGSKRRLLGLLETYWRPTYSRYLEPFVGSGALYFRLEPRRAVLSDINHELVGTLEAVVSKPKQVYEACHGIPTGSEWYYALRSIGADELSPIDRAARFLYLNRNCFNGLFRTNQQGNFNVPFAPSKTGALPSLRSFQAAATLLRTARIVHGDFEEVTRSMVRAGDFVYLDPPYAVENRRVFRQYDAASFGLDDLKRLRRLLKFIDSKGAAFVLSYAYSREALTLARGWHSRRTLVTRNISGFASHRRRAMELIVTNRPLPD